MVLEFLKGTKESTAIEDLSISVPKKTCDCFFLKGVHGSGASYSSSRVKLKGT